MSVNVNIFNFNSIGASPEIFSGINDAALSGVNDILSNIFSDFAQLFDSADNSFIRLPSTVTGF